MWRTNNVAGVGVPRLCQAGAVDTRIRIFWVQPNVLDVSKDVTCGTTWKVLT